MSPMMLSPSTKTQKHSCSTPLSTSSSTTESRSTYEPNPKRIRGGGGGIKAGDKSNKKDDNDEILFDEDMEENDTQPVEEDYDDGLLPREMLKKCARPAVSSSYSPLKESLSFQWFDIDMIADKPFDPNTNANPTSTGIKPKSSNSGVTCPVIRVFGVNAVGNSVCAYIHGYTPYGYFAIPSGYNLKSDDYLEKIQETLDDRLRSSSRRGDSGPCCIAVKYVTDKKSIMGFFTSHNRFLKVYVGMPTMLPTLKRIMEEGMSLPGIHRDGNNSVTNVEYQPFECNVPFVLRFMIDRDITGAGWLTFPAAKYSNRRVKQSHCQIEVDIQYTHIISRKSEGEWSKMAPLRVLSFDIECQGRKGHFPEAEHDPVIQIANIVKVYGTDTPVVQNVFTLKGCLSIPGAHIISSDTEQQLLLKWRAFFQAADPDFITGYNIQNFDIPYLLDRASALDKQAKKNTLKPFHYWGRIPTSSVKMKEAIFQSAAFGRRSNIETVIEGRVIFDMFPYMQRNHKLSSYSLNSVCAEFLQAQKEDVHHSIISDLQEGSDETRHRLAVYCLKDADLPLRLMDKLSVVINYVEMARVTGVSIDFLLRRGQQIKVFSMILRKCKDTDMLVPTLKKFAPNGEDGYEGATVLDPIKSYYTQPIATLDFASLYPSIMQAYNLCYSTLISPQDLSKLETNQYQTSGTKHSFCNSKVKKGVLPTILSELLTARKQAKKDMKNAPNEFERSVQNGRQLALKISANSVYGFTGALVGQLPCVPIAGSVTAYGRKLLEKTKEFVEEKYRKCNGYEFDAQVIYGDTDSVMVKFGCETVKETFPLAVEAAEKCSEIFPSPILLEFEKVYFPYLLMNKKRYAGLMWTNPDKYDYMDTKGLETVRRDNCALVREVIQTSLDKILIGQDTKGAINYVKSQISDLLQNKMDISRLVITKSLNKGAEYALGIGGKKDDYKIKQAHVELAARMKARDPGSAPQMGDRVPYVVITGPKNAKTFEKAEDPIYVLENNLPIDCKWYLSNQLSKPLTRIFEPIIQNVERELLQGDHTRKIFIPTPSARKGSLMMFTVKGATCIGCKCTIDKNMGHLCKHCIPNESTIYLQKLDVLREAELRYAQLWSAAQRIHGAMMTDIMCTGNGCMCQFYRRKKAQADVRLAQEALEKFGVE